MSDAPKRRGRPAKSKAPVDMSLLSAEKRAELDEQLDIEIQAERLLAAEEAYLDEQRAEKRRGKGLEESMHEITLDLPEFADRMRIDGVVYFHGASYTVGLGLYNVLREQVQRMWGHQDEIDGKRSDPRRPLDRVMNRHGVVNTLGSLRV